MALSNKAIKEIARRSGLTIDQIKKAIENEAEVDLEFAEDIEVLTKSDLETRDANNIKQGEKQGEGKGETKGKELAAKALRAKLGLDTDSKDIDEVARLASEKIKADDAAKQQITQLQRDLAERDGKISMLEGTANTLRTDYELMSFLPKNLNPSIPSKVILSTLKERMEFKEDGIYLDGNLLTHPQNRNPLAKKDAIDHYFKLEEAKGFLAPQDSSGGGGRGKGDEGSTVSKFKNMSEWREDYLKRNPTSHEASEEAMAELSDYIAKNPDFEAI